MKSNLPKQLGRYEIVGLLATGGMAEVFLARLMGPSGFERVVVLKRIFPHLAREADLVNMFLDEGRIAARINHPNVVQVSDLGRDGEELFLTMEFIEGESLGGLMRRHWSLGKPIGHELAAYIVSEACAGLHAAHELKTDDGADAHVIHRDVSPQNIMLSYGGHVKVVDFGIAKAADRVTKTQTGELKGKVEYMSPEQARSETLDRRSDIFSLGILLFELVAGKRLFRRAGELASLRAVSEDPIPLLRSVDPQVPAALETIAARALSRSRAERYATADEMRRDLVQYLRSTPNMGAHGEVLAARMRELFADRLEHKSDLLRSVRTGTGSREIPAAEVDLTVEQPVVVATLTPSTRAASLRPAAARGPASKLKLFGVVIGAVAVGGIGALAFIRSRDVDEGARALGNASQVADASSASNVGVQGAPPIVEPAASSDASARTSASSAPSALSSAAQRPTGARTLPTAAPAKTTPTATASSPYRRFN